jgi:two-component system sensor histidine kinase YesM
MKHYRMLNSFYTRVLFINTLVFFVITSILVVVTSFLASEYERNNTLKKHDTALSVLYAVFYDKHNNFSELMSNFFKTTANYNSVCGLLSATEPEHTDVLLKAQVVDTLIDLCSVDRDIVGVLLHSTTTKNTYYYSQSSGIIKPIRLNGSFPKNTPYDRYTLTDSQLRSLSEELNGNSSRLYGLAGFISAATDDKRYMLLGEIVVLYSPSGMSRAISNQYFDADVIFSITDLKGNVIFNSAGDYALVTEGLGSGENHDRITRNGAEYYTHFLQNSQRSFKVTYYVPKTDIDINARYIQSLILLIAGSICILSLASYLYAYRLSMRKIRMVEKGMANIGSHNLSYRIPLTKGGDEFANIITHFNQMCDSLQANIDKLYTYEIQQKSAELYALQTSINPHFLYNTLESIRVRLGGGANEDAAQMLVLLSKLYRGQIKGRMFVTIFEELSQCKMLIELNMCRFQNFEYAIRIPGYYYQYGLPKNTLQPLIENYFEHGIDPNREDNLIELSASWEDTEDGRCIRITVSDNGKAMTQEELEALRGKLAEPIMDHRFTGGFGLVNVNNRLRIVFGPRYGLKIELGEGGRGVRIDILMKPMTPEVLSVTYSTLQTVSDEEEHDV